MEPRSNAVAQDLEMTDQGMSPYTQIYQTVTLDMALALSHTHTHTADDGLETSTGSMSTGTQVGFWEQISIFPRSFNW